MTRNIGLNSVDQKNTRTTTNRLLGESVPIGKLSANATEQITLLHCARILSDSRYDDVRGANQFSGDSSFLNNGCQRYGRARIPRHKNLLVSCWRSACLASGTCTGCFNTQLMHHCWNQSCKHRSCSSTTEAVARLCVGFVNADKNRYLR